MLLKNYIEAYSRVFKLRWLDSTGKLSERKVKQLKEALKEEKDSIIKSLTAFELEILNMQIQRKVAGQFFSNYGGLFNKKDRSLVWFAAGPRGVSRENFKSMNINMFKIKR